MADPQKYTPGYSYSGWEGTNPTKPKPGPELDADFANVGQSVNQTIDALKSVRRSDGKLNNGIVTPDSLASDTLLGIRNPTTWMTGQKYDVNDAVFASTAGKEGLFRATTAHTSGVFATDLAAGKWVQIFDSMPEVPIYPTIAGMPATPVATATRAIRLNGKTTVGDGLGGLYVDSNNGSTDTFVSSDGRTWYRAPARFTMPADQAAFFPAPPSVENWDYRWPVFRMPGGVEERAKDVSVADFQAVMNEAVATGEKLDVPKWLLPIRSNGAAGGGVITAGIDVDIECADGATFIVGEAFFGATANVFQFVGNAATAVDAYPVSRFRWKGGVISARQLTASHGQSTGFASGMMNVVGFFKPILSGVFFDGGTTTPALNTIGAGAMDTGAGWNQNTGGGMEYCGFRGFYDVAVYGNGYRVVSTLPNNPITSLSAGSALATVFAAAHGMRNGDRCFLQGAAVVDGLTFATSEYAVSSATTDTFQVSATSGTATVGGVAGGGAGVIFTNSRSNKRSESISGESSLFLKNWVTRCTNGFAIKRNMRDAVFAFNTFRDTANGIGTSGVGEYAGGDGKRLKIFGNDFYNIMNWPIRLQGGGPEIIVESNTIENFGRQYYDGGATAVNLSTGFPLSGIQIDSADAASIKNNSVIMTGNFVGATWIAGEEPAAIRFDKNSTYISGCVDCEIDGNRIIDVPQPYNDSSNNLRTRIGKKNFIRGATKASVYGSAGVVIETSKQFSAPGNSLASTTPQTIAIAHGLDFTPPKAACSVSFGSASGATVMTGITAQVTATDGTNVTVTLNNPSAQTGKIIDLYVKIDFG